MDARKPPDRGLIVAMDLRVYAKPARVGFPLSDSGRIVSDPLSCAVHPDLNFSKVTRPPFRLHSHLIFARFGVLCCGGGDGNRTRVRKRSACGFHSRLNQFTPVGEGGLSPPRPSGIALLDLRERLLVLPRDGRFHDGIRGPAILDLTVQRADAR